MEVVEVAHFLEEVVGCWMLVVVEEGFLQIAAREHSNRHRSTQEEQRGQVEHP